MIQRWLINSPVLKNKCRITWRRSFGHRYNDTVALVDAGSALRAGQVIEKHLKANTPPEGIIEDLYLRALSRKPKDKELNAMLELVGSDTRDRKPYQDIFWSLLNSTEFIFNH